MELVLQKGDSSRSDIIMIHGGKEICWNISAFERTDRVTDEELVQPLNQYWSRLSQTAQDEIFKLYSRIHLMMADCGDLDSMTYAIQRPIAELLDKYHDLDKVQEWADLYSDLLTPPDFKDSMEFEAGSPDTPDKTYLKRDYRKLLALAVALRAVVPIWGEFIDLTQSECGTDFKEYYAERLLRYSKVSSSDAMNKLMRYITAQLPAERTFDGAIWTALSSDEIPAYMLARILVRRVCVGSITGANPTTHLLKSIFMYIRQRNNPSKSSKKSGSNRGFVDNLRPKFSEIAGDSDDGDAKLSKLEGYKIQEKLSRFIVMRNRFYLENVHQVAIHVEPGIDLRLIDESLASIQGLEHEMLEEGQVALIKWTLKPAISPHGLDIVKKMGLLQAAAVAQSVLWHRGHRVLAALSSSYAQQVQQHQVFTVESRNRVTKDLQEELQRLFPFARKPGGKTSKVVNVAMASIDTVAQALCSKEWVLTLPDSWLPDLDPAPMNRRYVAPSDIKIKLAQHLCESINLRRRIPDVQQSDTKYVI